MITFLCSHCGAPLRVRPEAAGTTGPCPRCGKPVQAPQEGPPAHKAGPGSSAQRRAGSSGQPGQLKAACKPGSRPAIEAASSAREGDLDFLAPPQEAGELGRLGPYRVLQVLGTGAMGIVLQAEDVALRRQVALKVMKKQQADCEVNRLRFLREAQAAAAIEHDHIVTIYQVGVDRGVPYLAMKLLKGESLEDRLNRVGKLPADEVVRIGREIAEGLAEAHERGLIHRDIKPANIWLEEGRDRVKIVDFGLALDFNEKDARLTAVNYMVGTPMYMSPEQAEGEGNVDARCDLFSLGGVLYRMSTGALPFKGKTTMAVLTALATKEPRPPIDVNPELPPALSDYILLLLQKKADARPKTARLVVAALAEIAEAPAGYEEVAEEEPEELLVEEAPEEEEPAEPQPRPRPRHKARPKRKPARKQRDESGEAALERKVIKLAIFAGVCVFLLLAFLFVKRRFFPPRDDEGKPQSSARAPAWVGRARPWEPGGRG
jgi:serine/threonine protein kinase